MPSLYFFLTLILAVSTLIFAFLFWQSQKPGRKQLENAENQSYEILSQAIKKAENLMSSSELEALKLTADSKFYKKKLEEKFNTEIETSIQVYLKAFADYTENMKIKFSSSQEDYINYIQYLKNESDKSRNESIDAVRQQISLMFGKFEENLTDFLSETQKHSVESIDIELKATRQLIETYKANQLKIIDENIIAMLEKTISLVLAKKLTLKDQIDLVYESLEQAKNEKFLI